MKAPSCAAWALIAVAAATGPAAADGFADYGSELAARKFASPREHTDVTIDGGLRVRGEMLDNLDLDRGLTPSGQPLFPTPLGNPDGQILAGADTRLRTDLAIYPRGTGVDVKVRVDVLDNLGFGSTPEGKPATTRAPTPAASPGQRPPLQALRVKRAYGEVLTPFGLLAAGRMGAQWGMGLVANSGDCDDCDGGDSADRIAFVSPMFGHLWAAAYDFSASGPQTRRRDSVRVLDLDPTDDVRTVTFAVMRAFSPLTRLRLRQAGRTAFEYGAYVSHRWQQNDVPADYLPTANPMPLTGAQVMARGYGATAVNIWLRLALPQLRVEAEGAYLSARVDQPSLVPGVLLDGPVTSDQLGLAVQSEFTSRSDSAAVGLDLGYASGDDAPGFGAFPAPGAPAAQPGDLDGPQADLPRDRTVNNFRFHPDFRIDRILFREIIGTVTDAIYLRPTARYRLLDVGHARLDADAALIASWAARPESTPSGQRALGLELDPGLHYVSNDGFRAALEYALFLPGPAFDNPDAGLTAQPAQSIRLRLGYYF